MQNRTAQRTTAAADIEPVDSSRQVEPVQVTLCDRPAPAADVRLVREPYVPDIQNLSASLSNLCGSVRQKTAEPLPGSSAVKQHAFVRVRYFKRMRARCTPCASRMDMYTTLPLPNPTIE